MSNNEKYKDEIISNVGFSRNLAEYYLDPNCPHELPEMGRELLASALANGLSEANTQRVIKRELRAIASMMSAFRVVCDLTSYSNFHEKMARQPLSEGGRKGAESSLKTRKATAESGWKRIIKAMIKDIEDNPTEEIKKKMDSGAYISMHNLYAALDFAWKETDISLPSTPTVYKYFRELSDNGDIQFKFKEGKKVG